MIRADELSAEELDALIAKKAPVATARSGGISADQLSAEELDALINVKESSSGVGEIVSNVLSAAEPYAGAPMRAGIRAAQKGENPLAAFANQFGSKEGAPSGEEIVVAAGVPDKEYRAKLPSPVHDMLESYGERVDRPTVGINPAKVAGVGMEVASDPVSWVPGEMISNALSKGGKIAATGAKVAAGAAADTKVGKAAVGTGKVASAAAKTTYDAGKAVGKAIGKMINPTQASDWNELAAIAERNGIDLSKAPEALEFGQNSTISRGSRQIAEGQFGEGLLKNYDSTRAAVDHAISQDISRIGGRAPEGQISAGRIIREGYDEALENLSRQTDITYDTIQQLSPGMVLTKPAAAKIESKLSGIEKFAKGREIRGITDAQRGQATQLLRAVEAVREGNGSFKQSVEAMREIGDVAFKSINTMADIPPDVEKLRDLYFTMREALFDTVKSQHRLGPMVAEDLRRSNEIFSKFFNDKSYLTSIGSKTVSDEDVFRTLVSSGNSAKIEALKGILSPERFQALKGEFLESLVKRDPHGEIVSYRGIFNSLRGKQPIVEVLFSPEEIRNLADLIRLGDRMGSPVLSSSGTGASNAFMGLAKGTRDYVTNDLLVKNLKDKARKLGPEVAASEHVGPNARRQLSAPSPPSNPMQPARQWNVASFGPVAASSSAAASRPNKEPQNLKGEAKWANDGLKKLIEHGNPLLKNQKAVEKILASPKGKQLLIAASNHKPGSKAMQNITEQITKFAEAQ